MEEETSKNEKETYTDPITGKFVVGNPGGGRPPDTPEKKLEKKIIAQLVEEYKESLAYVLPALAPVLKDKALTGDVPAIKEVHDRIMGKARETRDVNIKDVTPIYGGLSQHHSNEDNIQTDQEN